MTEYIRPIGSIKIKAASDLALVLGKKLAATMIETVRGTEKDTQKKPRRVTFYGAKPAYYLNDGDTLHFYRVDVVTGTITGYHYAGSAESAVNNGPAQFSEGQVPDPMVDAVLAVRKYWGGNQTFWEIDVISQHVNQLAAQPAVAALLSASH